MQRPAVLDRPRNMPARTGLGVAALVFYGTLWGAASADVIPSLFHLRLESVIIAFQVLLFAGPVIGFVVTRRIALGLQARDAEQLAHGFETGRIVRLPGGEYEEIHRALDAETARALGTGPLTEAIPTRHGEGWRTPLDVLRVTLSHWYERDARRSAPDAAPDARFRQLCNAHWPGVHAARSRIAAGWRGDPPRHHPVRRPGHRVGHPVPADQGRGGRTGSRDGGARPLRARRLIMLLPLALARRQVLVVLKRWRPLLAYTVIEIVIPWFFLSTAEQKLPSSTAGLLIAAVPLVGVAVAVRSAARRGSRCATGWASWPECSASPRWSGWMSRAPI